MNYGFLIRNDRCIGCHACSTACKSENQVPLGVHRTWVKNVEIGSFPNVRRHFQVTRCNHCANPPCVEICPTTAMYRREDGIVEFDPQRCIGCKACLQACPYDAIHIDPDSGTAAKCHFCAHRVELDLEPACVVVCPEHAIISGDMDDPDSEISRMLAEHQVTVRKPEQGTQPKLFYVDGEDVALHPTVTDPEPTTFAWADSLERSEVGVPRRKRAAATGDSHTGVGHTGVGHTGVGHTGVGHTGAEPAEAGATGASIIGGGSTGGSVTGAGVPGAIVPGAGTERAGVTGAGAPGASAADARAAKAGNGKDAGPADRAGTTPAQSRGRGPASGERVAGPIRIGRGRMAGEMVQTAYNVQHAVPWHWPVPAYLVTKGVGAGLFLLLALGTLTEFFPFHLETYLVCGFLSLLFTGITTVLLVADLERPARFLSVLTRPQWRSWLVRGAYILMAFSALVGSWWIAEVGAYFGLLPPQIPLALRPVTWWAGTPLALATAVYTAYLFGQAEGRDLWQSTLLPFHLVVQALVAGASALLMLGAVTNPPQEFLALAAWVFVAGITLDLCVLLPGELGTRHASDSAAEAAEAMVRGRYRRHFWWGGVVLGHLVPLALLGAAALGGGAASETVGAVSESGGALVGLAGACALVGLYLYEYAYVMAPQHVPNS